MNSWYHSKSSAKKWGGSPHQYIDIHEFIDSSKKIIGDVRHRSVYHHTEGVWLCQRIFGRTLLVGGRFAVPQEINYIIEDPEPSITGPALEIIDCGHIREVPVRLIAELHIIQDLGWIPSPSDYIKNMELQQWMGGPVRKEQNLDSFMQSKETSLPVSPQPSTAYLDKRPSTPYSKSDDKSLYEDFLDSFLNKRNTGELD